MLRAQREERKCTKISVPSGGASASNVLPTERENQGSRIRVHLLSSVQPLGVRSWRTRTWRTPGCFPNVHHVQKMQNKNAHKTHKNAKNVLKKSVINTQKMEEEKHTKNKKKRVFSYNLGVRERLSTYRPSVYAAYTYMRTRILEPWRELREG
jgi:hypothetical protein